MEAGQYDSLPQIYKPASDCFVNALLAFRGRCGFQDVKSATKRPFGAGKKFAEPFN
jgi:hypothetical protein